MTVSDLVSKCEAAKYRTDVIARMIGYAVLIQRAGGIDNLNVSRATRFALSKNFRSLGVDPETVVF